MNRSELKMNLTELEWMINELKWMKMNWNQDKWEGLSKKWVQVTDVVVFNIKLPKYPLRVFVMIPDSDLTHPNHFQLLNEHI